MKTTYPCLVFDGNTEKVFEYYKAVFGGSFGAVMRYGEMGETTDMPEAERRRIAHISLPIGDSLLIGSDTIPSYAKNALVAGNNFYITIEPESGEESDRIFDMLCAGGDVEMPLMRTEWAEKFGQCSDRFGVQWMVNYSGDVEWTAPEQAEAGV
jgi:PhnB protein